MTEKSPTIATWLQTLRHQLRYLPRTFLLVWTASRHWTTAWAVLLTLQGLLPVAIVYLTRWIVDGLVKAVAAGGSWSSVRPILVLAVIMAGVMLASELLSSAARWVRAGQSELVQQQISMFLQEKSLAVDLAFYETPEYYDHLHRARAEARHRPLALLENVGSLAQNSITLAAMAMVLIPFGFWLPIALLLSTFPALFAVLRHTQREHEWRLRRTPAERRAWYYDWLLTSGEAAAELRTFGLGAHFAQAFQALRRELRNERLRLARDQSFAEAAARTFALLVSGMALTWMAWKTVRGLISLGELAFFYQAFYQGQRLMHSLLENVGRIYANSLFLSNLFEFLDLGTQIVDPPHPARMPAALRDGIHFKGVTFRYPGTERLALRDCNLFIPAGKTVAIVGTNGAGKSTLIKLICRLYDPEEGYIHLDGINLRDFSLRELRDKISVLFQQPVHHAETVAENIRLGHVTRPADLADIQRATAAGGAEEVVERLPQGYQTLLSKWFEQGTELSTGEWKRVCLARTLFRPAAIILLDEPTSGMDSWAETHWMDRLPQVTRGKTVLIISHRLTTAMRADLIHVMHDGQIIESGRHEELLAAGGQYARSWQRQHQSSTIRHRWSAMT